MLAPRALYAELLSSTERSKRESYDVYMKRVVDYKATATKELDHRRRVEMSEDDLIPHAEDIIMNTSAGTVEIKGPMTREEKKAWDELARRRDEAAAQIRAYQNELKTETDAEKRADLRGGHRDVPGWPRHARR
jgi:hypothetical protein